MVASNREIKATNHFDTKITYGWGLSVDTNGEFYIGDVLAAGAPSDAIWKYQADGTLTEDKIPLGFVQSFYADSAFDTSTAKLWQINVGGNNCIHEIDVVEQQETGKTICPSFGNSQRGLAYDAVTDTFYAGSWNDGIIHQFKKDGTIVRSINTSLPIAGLAFNATTGHLFASLSYDTYDIVVLDANTEELEQLEGLDIVFDKDGDGIASDTIVGMAAVDMDCNGNLWVLDQEAQIVVGVPTGEETNCDLTPDWASIEDTTGTLQINEAATIVFTVDTNQELGEYDASLVFKNSTPYGSKKLPINLTVREAMPGNFSITDIEVNEADMATLTVTRADGADYAVSVDYATVDDTALVGEHYTAATGTLTWADNDTEPKTFTVQTNQLGNIQDDLSFDVVLTNAQGGAVITTETANISIINIPNGAIQFTVTDATVQENGNVTLSVVRVDAANFAISVDYTTVDGTGAAGSDYTESSGTLTWADQDTETKTITVAVGDVSSDKSFSITLSNPQGGANLGASSSATVNILNTPEPDNSGSGGSIGFYILVLLSLMSIYRRKKF